MRHIHADHIIAAANDTSIEWEYLEEYGDWCLTVNNIPYWNINVKYRQKAKAKKTVDMWQWAYTVPKGYYRTTVCLYSTGKEAQQESDGVMVHRIEGSKITVEVDE